MMYAERPSLFHSVTMCQRPRCCPPAPPLPLRPSFSSPSALFPPFFSPSAIRRLIDNSEVFVSLSPD